MPQPNASQSRLSVGIVVLERLGARGGHQAVDRLAKAVGQGLRAVGSGRLGQGRVNGQKQPGQAKPDAGCMFAKRCHAVRVSLAKNGSSEKPRLAKRLKT